MQNRITATLFLLFLLVGVNVRAQFLEFADFAPIIMVNEADHKESSIPFGAIVFSSGTFSEIYSRISELKKTNPNCIIILDGQIEEIPDPDVAFLIDNQTQRKLFLRSLALKMGALGINYIIRRNNSLDSSCRSYVRNEQNTAFALKNIGLIKWTDKNANRNYHGLINSLRPGGINQGIEPSTSDQILITHLPAYLNIDGKSLLRRIKISNFIYAQDLKQVRSFIDELISSRLFNSQDLLNKVQINKYKFSERNEPKPSLSPSHNYSEFQNIGHYSYVILDTSRLPLTLNKTRNISIIQLGRTKLGSLKYHLNLYAPVSIKRYTDDLTGIYKYLEAKKDNQIVFVLETRLYKEFDAQLISKIEELQKEHNAILLLSHQNQYLEPTFKADILSFDLSKISQKALAEALFAAKSARNTLPYPIGNFDCRFGLSLKRQNILHYDLPEDVGISTVELKKIDNIIYEAIEKEASPGCQVLIAKNQKIIWDKAYGYQDYSKKRRSEPHHIYDLASLTKILSTTQLLMTNWEKQKFSLDDEIGSLLPELSGEIATVKIRDLLTHRSGLQSFMPIFDLMSDEDLNNRYHELYCEHEDDDYCVKVAEDLYLRKDFVDSIWLNITKLDPKQKRYRYSDVNFNLLKRLIERQNGEDLYSTLLDELIVPLNLQSLCFRPADCFPLELIVPTQIDISWRKQLLHGYVHDYATALMGGVSGSAGLFSNTRDLAIVAQMWLNEGSYGGQQLLKEETISIFTKTQSYSHRGLGFNKPHPNGRSSGIAVSASSSTYGHTGFTGTCIWIDPKENLIFVFLSNRVHPDEHNNQLQKLKIRERIHEQIYKSLNSHPIN